MNEQNSKPAQPVSEQIPCLRCHGSGRVGYVMADGRRGKYRCPDCVGLGKIRDQREYTCLLCEGRGDMPVGLGSTSREICGSCQGKGVVKGSLLHNAQLLARQAALGSPTTTQAPANAPRASNAQQRVSWEQSRPRFLWGNPIPFPAARPEDWFKLVEGLLNQTEDEYRRSREFEEAWVAWTRE